MKPADFLQQFVAALEIQLEEDNKRWGKTWLQRSPEGQELRTRATFNNYFDMFESAGTPVPWLKVAGEALICFIRDKYPEIWDENPTEVLIGNAVVMYSCQDGDWVGVYKDWLLVYEGHSMNGYTLENICPMSSFKTHEFNDVQEERFQITGKMPSREGVIKRWN